MARRYDDDGNSDYAPEPEARSGGHGTVILLSSLGGLIAVGIALVATGVLQFGDSEEPNKNAGKAVARAKTYVSGLPARLLMPAKPLTSAELAKLKEEQAALEARIQAKDPRAYADGERLQAALDKLRRAFEYRWPVAELDGTYTPSVETLEEVLNAPESYRKTFDALGKLQVAAEGTTAFEAIDRAHGAFTILLSAARQELLARRLPARAERLVAQGEVEQAIAQFSFANFPKALLFADEDPEVYTEQYFPFYALRHAIVPAVRRHLDPAVRSALAEKRYRAAFEQLVVSDELRAAVPGVADSALESAIADLRQEYRQAPHNEFLQYLQKAGERASELAMLEAGACLELWQDLNDSFAPVFSWGLADFAESASRQLAAFKKAINERLTELDGPPLPE